MLGIHHEMSSKQVSGVILKGKKFNHCIFILKESGMKFIDKIIGCK